MQSQHMFTRKNTMHSPASVQLGMLILHKSMSTPPHMTLICSAEGHFEPLRAPELSAATSHTCNRCLCRTWLLWAIYIWLSSLKTAVQGRKWKLLCLKLSQKDICAGSKCCLWALGRSSIRHSEYTNPAYGLVKDKLWDSLCSSWDFSHKVCCFCQRVSQWASSSFWPEPAKDGLLRSAASEVPLPLECLAAKSLSNSWALVSNSFAVCQASSTTPAEKGKSLCWVTTNWVWRLRRSLVFLAITNR